jgi:hypothetical protein
MNTNNPFSTEFGQNGNPLRSPVHAVPRNLKCANIKGNAREQTTFWALPVTPLAGFTV